MILLGLGAGTSFPALMKLAMSSATPQDAGLASGLVNTSAQVGGAIGLAVLATVAADRTETLTANGDSFASAVTGGYHVAFVIAAALVVASIVVGIFVCEEVSEEAMQPGMEPEGEGDQPEPRDSGRPEPAYSEA